MGDPHHGDAPSALLAWRSPPSCRRRCPAFFPESAGTGDTPHRWAQAASEWSRSGLSPAATKSEAAVSGPTPKRASRSGAVAQEQRLDLLVEVGELGIESPGPGGPVNDSDALVAAVTGSGDRVDRSLALSATRR